MSAPRPADYYSDVRLYWTHLLKRRDWRFGTSSERRELEIRYCLAHRLRLHRRRRRVTQKQLAEMIGAAQPTISKIERASPRATIEIFIRAMLALGANDVEIAVAFNAGVDVGIQRLRLKGELPGLMPRDATVAQRQWRLRQREPFAE
jgi:transcriptional regulator with XRE-family HTH domain